MPLRKHDTIGQVTASEIYIGCWCYTVEIIFHLASRASQIMDFFARCTLGMTWGHWICSTWTSFAIPVRSLWSRRRRKATGAGGGGSGERALNGIAAQLWSRDFAPAAYVICDVIVNRPAQGLTENAEIENAGERVIQWKIILLQMSDNTVRV